jgi:twitching motility protein PilT
VPAIDKLFDQLLAKGASDLHLSVGYPPMTRVRGDLVAMGSVELTPDALTELLLPILLPSQREIFEAERDLDFAYAYGSRARFRASYFQKASGIAAVFRSIPIKIPSLADLGAADSVKALASRTAGLVLVTGPSGSGKSTTLAAMVRHVNETRPCHVLTIEDPIEFVHAPQKAQVTHREIGQHASTLAAALESAAREDANVVLIGELRDADSTRLSLTLAGAGVLVLATVHASSAPLAVERVANAFPEAEQAHVRAMLAECLLGVISQELLRGAEGQGRVMAQEILITTPPIAAMIREGKTRDVASAMQAGRALGMQTLDMALERLVQQRRVTYDVALERYSDRENAEKKLKPMKAGGP